MCRKKPKRVSNESKAPLRIRWKLNIVTKSERIFRPSVLNGWTELLLSSVLILVKLIPEGFVRYFERNSPNCCMQIKGILQNVFTLHISEKNTVRRLICIYYFAFL